MVAPCRAGRRRHWNSGLESTGSAETEMAIAIIRNALAAQNKGHDLSSPILIMIRTPAGCVRPEF
jgi:hypothetical protein